MIIVKTREFFIDYQKGTLPRMLWTEVEFMEPNPDYQICTYGN